MSPQPNLQASLEAIVGRGNYLAEPEALGSYAIEGILPQAAAFPGNREELSALVSFGAAQGLVMVPWGGGTKMSLGNIPPRVDLVIGTKRLDRLVDYDIANLSVSVEAGMPLARLQEQLGREGRGFFVPLDPPGGSQATLGGIVAANDSGPARFLYGTARDHILGLKMVSPMGKQVAAGGKTVKNVAGYDLTKLIIGSWGTLGIISEVTFKLLPLPEKRSTVILSFSDRRPAGQMAAQVLHSRFYPATIEMLNPRTASLLDLQLPEGYLLALALEGFTEAVDRLEREMTEMGKKSGAAQADVIAGPRQEDFWSALRDLPRILKDSYPEMISLKISLPLSQYDDFLSVAEKSGKEAGLEAAWSGRAGNGLLYGHLPIEENVLQLKRNILDFINMLNAEAAKRGGSLVLQQGPKVFKEERDVWGINPQVRKIMRRIKEQFDPADLMNSGRFV